MKINPVEDFNWDYRGYGKLGFLFIRVLILIKDVMVMNGFVVMN